LVDIHWFVDYLLNPNFKSFLNCVVVRKGRHCDDLAILLCFEPSDSGLFLNYREPILLSRQNPFSDHKTVDFRHLNVRHHEPVNVLAAFRLNFKLVQFDGCRTAADTGRLNFEASLKHALQRVEVENVVVHEEDFLLAEQTAHSLD